MTYRQNTGLITRQIKRTSCLWIDRIAIGLDGINHDQTNVKAIRWTEEEERVDPRGRSISIVCIRTPENQGIDLEGRPVLY